MTTHESQPKGIWEILKNNWAAILFIGSLIVTWTNFNNSVKMNQERIQALEAKVIAVDNSQNQILVQLSQIQTDVLWIKKGVNSITK